MHYILCKGNLSNKIINFSWHLDLIKPLADAEKQEKKTSAGSDSKRTPGSTNKKNRFHAHLCRGPKAHDSTY